MSSTPTQEDGVRREPSSARESDRRAQIIRISAELFARNGYHATGVSEIGEAVGLGKGALYHHIGSKEQLLYEIVAPPTSELVAAAEQILALDISAEEKFRRMSRRLMRSIADHLPQFTVFFSEFHAFQGALRTELLALRERFEEILVEMLREGYAAGEFQTDDPIVIKALLGVHNYTYLWYHPSGPQTPESLSDTFCDLLLSGLLKR
jgi:AcrR family transcriptional regulator